MKSKDIIENYLIELGVSLKNDYVYIPKREYQYSSTKGKTETIKLGNYDVKLDKIIRNTRELFFVTNISRNTFINTVTLNGNIGKACEKLMSYSVLYYAEFLKYIVNNIDIKADFAEKLISLLKGAIDFTDREIGNIISEFNVGMDKARSKGDWHNANLTAQALAEANKIKGFHTDVYDTSGLFGESYTIYATPITTGTAKRNEMLSMASGAASQIQSMYEEIASDRAIESLRKVRTKVIDNFNRQLKELLLVKLNTYFEESLLDNTGTNIGDNPIIYGHYLDVINDLTEDQFEGFKQAVEYYSVNIINDLKKSVEDNIYNYYINEEKCDYDNIDYKLYVYLTKDEFGAGSDVAIRIKNYLSKLEFGTQKENKNLIATFDKKKLLVNECKYLTKEEKTTILQSYEDFKEKNAKANKNNIINIVLSIILVITGLYAIVTAWKYTILFGVYNGSIYLFGFGGIVISLILSFCTFIMNKNIFKKILQVLLSVAFIIIPIALSKPISEEEDKREGKYMIKLEVLEEREIIFLEKGELVPLDKIEMDGYVFNGWTKEYRYVIEPVYVDGDDEFVADIYDTNERLSTVTFKFGNGQKNMVVKVPINSEVPLPPTPERKGYKFVGWYEEELYKMHYSKPQVRLEKVTFRAEWEKIK